MSLIIDLIPTIIDVITSKDPDKKKARYIKKINRWIKKGKIPEDQGAALIREKLGITETQLLDTSPMTCDQDELNNTSPDLLKQMIISNPNKEEMKRIIAELYDHFSKHVSD